MGRISGSPNAIHRLNNSGSGVPSNPPMSWLQNAKPEDAVDKPPQRDSDMAENVDSQSPPQWTGNCCPPAVPEAWEPTDAREPTPEQDQPGTVLFDFERRFAKIAELSPGDEAGFGQDARMRRLLAGRTGSLSVE